MADFNGDGKLDFVLANAGVFLSTDVSLSPTSLTFSGSVGVPTALQTVILSNSSATSIYVGGISFSDEYPINFSQTNNCGTKLLAGASCSIDVTLVANNDLTFQSATMTVSETAGRSQSISLAGSASGSNPVVQLSSGSLNFGSQPVGQPSSSTGVKLANVGNANLRSLSVGITGTNASDFSISSNTCRATVKVDGTCAVFIVFSPSATGPRSATLSFADNAYNSPQTLALSGTGQ